MHTDHQYIEALKNHDGKMIERIYQNIAPGIKSYLLSKGADNDEAGDIFQEALIDVYKLACDGTFVLTCPLEPFLLLICKRKWINITEKNKRRGVTKSMDDGYNQVTNGDWETAAHYADVTEKEHLVMAMLQRVTERCREIIIASYTHKPQQQVADEMGVSYAYLRKKKSECMSELISLVRNNKT